mgnify:CR=1 FL=1
MVRFPISIGLTGIATEKRKVIISQTGDFDPLFSSEVDNILSVYKISNMMLVPIFDKNGDIRGMIHFINKLGKSKIPDTDSKELDPVIPTLGEIIKTADQGLQITNIAAGLKLYLG